MDSIILGPSPIKGKKFRVNVNGKNIDFGASGYSDFTRSKDKGKRAAYIARHQVREDWANIMTPGYWSRWLLWNRETLAESMAWLSDRIGVTIRWGIS
jgi:hypothetical protein